MQMKSDRRNAGDKQVKRGKGVVTEVSGCIFLECKYMMRPEAC